MDNKRIEAFIIDIIGYLFVKFILELAILVALGNIFNPQFGLKASIVIFFIDLFIYFILIETIFLQSIGKRLRHLKIKSINNNKANKLAVFCRSLLKFLTILSGLGLILNLLYYLTFNYMWYDRLCGLYVDDEKPIRLTETQKRWRKKMM